MSDEEDVEDDVIRCPFCDRDDECRHLVAAFDHENAAIGGGLFCNRESELSAIVREGFEAALAAHGESVVWDQGRIFDEAWDDYLDRRDEGEEDPLGSGTLAHVLDTLLRDTDAISEGDSGVVAFYDRRPQAIYEQVVAAIRKACSNARAKT